LAGAAQPTERPLPTLHRRAVDGNIVHHEGV
jgi:hypothetical protein